MRPILPEHDFETCTCRHDRNSSSYHSGPQNRKSSICKAKSIGLYITVLFLFQTTYNQRPAHPRCVPSGYFEAPQQTSDGNDNNNNNNNNNHDQQSNIRNVAVIAHVDHGKTTLSDALLNKAGLLHKNRVGDQDTGRSLDTLKDEKERGITIKSAAVTLNMLVGQEIMNQANRQDSSLIGMNHTGQPQSGTQTHDTDAETSKEETSTTNLVVNLIDSPGHIEFNAEVTAALRISDGALLVVDAIEGKAVQTEEVLIQALREGVTPVLMINKVDRLFIDLQLTAEQVYDALQRLVDDINTFILAHQLPNSPDLRVHMADGSVCFGSGYFGWSCSIDTFLRKLKKDDGTAGNLPDPKALRMSLAKRDNFVNYILKPIMRMHRACGVLPLLKKDVDGLDPVQRATELLVKVTGKSRIRLLDAGEDPTTIPPRKLLKKAMMAWLPAADALVDMFIVHVPSPKRAQRLRAPLLYSGDLEDECGQGISACDVTAPSVVYIAKMSPANGPTDKKMLAFGRVFSGTIRSGDTLRAIRTDGSETTTKISRIKICGIGGSMTSVPEAFAGQLIALEGVDQALDKAGTLTSSPIGCAIRHMKMAVTPILRHSVRPKEMRDLSKMVTELRRVVNADATALFYRDKEALEYILAGAGDLHIEVLVSSLMQASGIEVELSDPIIGYREIVQAESSETAMAKSDNKHNRIYVKASPLPAKIVEAMTTGELVDLDPKKLGKALVSHFKLDASDVNKIWSVGPEPLSSNSDEVSDSDQPTCILVDSTFGLQIPQDFRENIIAAFQQVVRQGILVHSPMRGVRFDLVDAKFHSDAPHRRPNSVVPAASRAMRGAFLLAEPSLSEPMYRVDITGATHTLNGAYAVLGQRSGTVVDASSTPTSDSIQALVPVRCARGLGDVLRLATQGHAHSSMVYGGMQMVPSAEQASVVLASRQRKKLSEAVPDASVYIDRL